MSSDEEIVRKIEKFLDDETFRDLNRDLSETTLFDVLGISFEERTHSRMLGWLLDPSESHGVGSTILRRFLCGASKLARDNSINFGEGNGSPIQPLKAETFSFSDLKIEPEYWLKTRRRPDFVLWSQSEKWLCVIENKILSDEGEEQTTDYYKEMLESFPAKEFPQRLFIYLSPNADAAPNSKHFISVGYSFIEYLLSRHSDLASPFGRSTIAQYIKCLGRRVLEQDHLEEICRKLYHEHHEAIKMIVRYGDVNQLATAIRDQVMESLQRERNPIIEGRRKWKSKSAKNWITIWPEGWPTGPSRGWPAFYGIDFETNGTTETVKRIGIWGNSPHWDEVRKLFWSCPTF